ncbi:MAG TPA: ATP-binding protein [Acidimicrobiales bacterium]|nr:ATP-binding protein [Acidimicrobiales bacterium]
MTDKAAPARRPQRERPAPEALGPWVLDLVAVALVDHHGVVSAASRRWCVLSGWHERSPVGTRWRDLAEPAALPDVADIPGVAATYRLALTGPGGGRAVVQAQATPLHGAGGPGGWLVVAVGAGEEDPGALRPASACRSPQEGLPAGAPASEAPGNSELVASVSHELRTPLTSIVSFTQLLRDGLGADSVDEQREFLDIIERNSDRLLRLVDDLLLLDRLESSSLALECDDVDIPTLVEVAASSIGPVAEARGVALRASSGEGPPLRGDPDRVGQLVDNLLANAVKFTPAGGTVRVAAGAAGDGWRLVVSDTGIGIPAAERGKLFQRFYRASNARQDGTSGSGLGLVIARRIAELHNGSIAIDSQEGRGTTVTVELRGIDAAPGPVPARGTSSRADASR